mmetsp:Transcript_10914/g.32775  ORF Transcript_10914/g.32775 Transcript_10914/m.32775 type:complete len:289 (-) Transcript_10914:87-953(-)
MAVRSMCVESREWMKLGGKPDFWRAVDTGSLSDWSTSTMTCAIVRTECMASRRYGCTTGRPRGVTQETGWPSLAMMEAHWESQAMMSRADVKSSDSVSRVLWATYIEAWYSGVSLSISPVSASITPKLVRWSIFALFASGSSIRSSTFSTSRRMICCRAPMNVTPYTDVITVCFTTFRSISPSTSRAMSRWCRSFFRTSSGSSSPSSSSASSSSSKSKVSSSPSRNSPLGAPPPPLKEEGVSFRRLFCRRLLFDFLVFDEDSSSTSSSRSVRSAVERTRSLTFSQTPA